MWCYVRSYDDPEHHYYRKIKWLWVLVNICLQSLLSHFPTTRTTRSTQLWLAIDAHIRLDSSGTAQACGRRRVWIEWIVWIVLPLSKFYNREGEEAIKRTPIARAQPNARQHITRRIWELFDDHWWARLYGSLQLRVNSVLSEIIECKVGVKTSKNCFRYSYAMRSLC